MLKNKTLLIVFTISLFSMTGIQACATSPTATQDTVTQPTNPTNTPAATTPSQPSPPSQESTTPAAPATVTDKPTSFSATTYRNDEMGFSIKYPRNWLTKEVKGAQVLDANSNIKGDIDSIQVFVFPLVTNLTDFLKKRLETINNVSIESESTKSITLTDGKTIVSEFIYTTISQNVNKTERYYYCTALNKGDKTITVIGNTKVIDGNKDLIQEIVQTLQFN